MHFRNTLLLYMTTVVLALPTISLPKSSSLAHSPRNWRQLEKRTPDPINGNDDDDSGDEDEDLEPWATSPPLHICQTGLWVYNTTNYNKTRATSQLQTYWQGGMDIDGISWPGARDKTNDFSNRFGKDMFDFSGFSCKDITSPCSLQNARCTEAGALNKWRRKVPSHWGWQAANAMVNMSGMLHRVWEVLNPVANKGAVGAMSSIQTFLPEDEDVVFDATEKSRGTLIGLSFLSTIFSSFPPFRVSIKFGITIFGSASTASQSSTALAIVDQKLRYQVYHASEFAEFVGNITDVLQSNIADLAETLFGAVVDNSNGMTLFEALGDNDDPGWINSDDSSINLIKDVIFRMVFSGVLNNLWGKKAAFVTFSYLDDDEKGSKCEADDHGPAITKYCADGGVYYLQRWAGNGKYGKIWGIDKLKSSRYGIDPKWIVESSAKAYRMQIETNEDKPFDFSDENINRAPALIKSFKDDERIEAIPRLPGVWTLPVCDMGPHPDWNVDWTADKFRDFVAPGYCGPNAKYTKAFWDKVLDGGHDCKIARILRWQSGEIFPKHTKHTDFPEELETDVIDLGFGALHRGKPDKVYGGECAI